MEAHAAASLGQPMHWETLFAFYGDVKPYTEQLRNLEKHVAAQPNDPAARFLLGYQYLMMGHNDAAKTELTKLLLQAPRDRLAANLLTQIGGKSPRFGPGDPEADGEGHAEGGRTARAGNVAPMPLPPGK